MGTRLIFGACVLFALVAVALLVPGLGEGTPADDFGLSGAGGVAFAIAGLAFGVTGSLIIARLPGNRVGWIFCAMGVLIGLGNLVYQYADYSLYVSPGWLPGDEGAAVLQNIGLTPCFGLLGLVLLLFPEKRLLSGRWRIGAVLALAGSVLVATGYALRPGPLDEPFEGVLNPFGLGSTETMDAVSGLGWMLMTLSIALGAASLVRRMRQATGAERAQLKWIGLAGVVIGSVFVANFLTYGMGIEGPETIRLVAVGLAFAGIPVAAGIAILRYRLYDIDVVINRTLVYGALTATLAGLYLGTVLLFQLALSGVTSESDLAIAASTLAVVAAFRPLRSRIQEGVDRRFYRSRYDARQILEGFSGRLRDQVELAALDAELRGGVVAETMQPAHVSLWLREEGRA